MSPNSTSERKKVKIQETNVINTHTHTHMLAKTFTNQKKRSSWQVFMDTSQCKWMKTIEK